MSDSTFFGLPSSDEQRAEVLRLLKEGASVRETARQVFGAERFHGRVERIKKAARRPGSAQPLPSPEELRALADVSTAELLRELVEAWVIRHRRGGRLPSPSQLRAATQVLQRLESSATADRLRTAHQERMQRPAIFRGAAQAPLD